MALIIGTWLWGDKYGRHYVERLAASVARHTVQDYRFMVFRPMESDEHLTKIPGCFARLRMFDPMWQTVHGIHGGLGLVHLLEGPQSVEAIANFAAAAGSAWG